MVRETREKLRKTQSLEAGSNPTGNPTPSNNPAGSPAPSNNRFERTSFSEGSKETQ